MYTAILVDKIRIFSMAKDFEISLFKDSYIILETTPHTKGVLLNIPRNESRFTSNVQFGENSERLGA